MPVIDRYEISIEGVLHGTLQNNGLEIGQFKAALTTAAPAAGTGGLGSGALWPDGFVLTGYTADIWKAEGYKYPSGAGGNTRLYFHAEISSIDDRELKDPTLQTDARQDFEWFITNDVQAWCTDLETKLGTLNGKFATKLAEPIRMRRFHWYLGDGGGG